MGAVLKDYLIDKIGILGHKHAANQALIRRGDLGGWQVLGA